MAAGVLARPGQRGSRWKRRKARVEAIQHLGLAAQADMTALSSALWTAVAFPNTTLKAQRRKQISHPPRRHRTMRFILRLWTDS